MTCRPVTRGSLANPCFHLPLRLREIGTCCDLASYRFIGISDIKVQHFQVFRDRLSEQG